VYLLDYNVPTPVNWGEQLEAFSEQFFLGSFLKVAEGSRLGSCRVSAHPTVDAPARASFSTLCLQHVSQCVLQREL